MLINNKINLNIIHQKFKNLKILKITFRVNKMSKGYLSNRERKKNKKSTSKDYHIYSAKHIRFKEQLLRNNSEKKNIKVYNGKERKTPHKKTKKFPQQI